MSPDLKCGLLKSCDHRLARKLEWLTVSTPACLAETPAPTDGDAVAQGTHSNLFGHYCIAFSRTDDRFSSLHQ